MDRKEFYINKIIMIKKREVLCHTNSLFVSFYTFLFYVETFFGCCCFFCTPFVFNLSCTLYHYSGTKYLCLYSMFFFLIFCDFLLSFPWLNNNQSWSFASYDACSCLFSVFFLHRVFFPSFTLKIEKS